MLHPPQQLLQQTQIMLYVVERVLLLLLETALGALLLGLIMLWHQTHEQLLLLEFIMLFVQSQIIAIREIMQRLLFNPMPLHPQSHPMLLPIQFVQEEVLI